MDWTAFAAIGGIAIGGLGLLRSLSADQRAAKRAQLDKEDREKIKIAATQVEGWSRLVTGWEGRVEGLEGELADLANKHRTELARAEADCVRQIAAAVEILQRRLEALEGNLGTS